MISKEEFKTLVDTIKEKLDETQQALISEDLLTVIANYTEAVDEVTNLGEKISKLETDNEELLKVNGKLFRKIGFENNEKEPVEDPTEVVKTAEEIIEDLIDEKGEIKYE